MDSIKTLSPLSRAALRIQGYFDLSDEQLADFRFGIRLPYGICGTLVFAGLIFHQVYFYYAAFILAVGGVVFSRHPVDYLYNHFIRNYLHKPAIPRRPPQGRFACSLASVWLAATLVCLQSGYDEAASAFVGALLMQTAVVAFTDVCFPSMIYNFLTSTPIHDSGQMNYDFLDFKLRKRGKSKEHYHLNAPGNHSRAFLR